MLKVMNYLTMTTVEILKERFKEVQNELKKQHGIKLRDFREFVFTNEPVYDCPIGYDKIKNAWYHKKPDLRLTELIKQYKKTLQPL